MVGVVPRRGGLSLRWGLHVIFCAILRCQRLESVSRSTEEWEKIAHVLGQGCHSSEGIKRQITTTTTMTIKTTITATTMTLMTAIMMTTVTTTKSNFEGRKERGGYNRSARFRALLFLGATTQEVLCVWRSVRRSVRLSQASFEQRIWLLLRVTTELRHLIRCGNLLSNLSLDHLSNAIISCSWR